MIAGESGICTVGLQGLGLNYRGYSIVDLADQSTFEEVAYLLIYGTLPTRKELNDYIKRLASYRQLSPNLKAMLELIPQSAHPMDVLRTACSFMGTIQSENVNQPKHQYELGDCMIAQFGPVLLYWYHFHHSNGTRRIVTETNETDPIATNFVKLMNQVYDDSKVNKNMVRAIDVSLILYAEHDFAASTFAARTTASTLSDIYSAVTTAIGTLRGPLHGGANEAAYNLISSFRSAQEAESGIMDMLKHKKLVMGFGHRVYRKGDPRSPIIKKLAKALSEDETVPKARPELFSVAERIESVMFREKKLFTNLDFYASITYHLCGVPTDFFTPIFVIARTSGWVAHVIEQRSANKLMRPISLYTGPQAKTYVPLDERVQERSNL